MSLVYNGIVKNDVSLRGLLQVWLDCLPNVSGTELIASEITIDLIMTERFTMVCEMSERIVDGGAE